MRIHIRDYRVDSGDKVDLSKWPTAVMPVYKSKEHYKELLDEHVEQLSKLQALLNASNRHALLLIFQGMDAAGKDGAIKHVFAGVNPQGCEVFSFKQPSAEELEHDFLWRTVCRLPERGRIGVFNRSWYEEVVVVRVHPELLAKESARENKSIWKDRYRSINDLERHLDGNGTKIVKFFLHLSKEEQRARLLKRIDDADHNWKLSMSDVEERKLWKQYRKAYEACLTSTSTGYAPWYVVPADDKENARLIVSQIVVDTLSGMGMRYPKADEKRLQELKSVRAMLAGDD